MRFLFVPFFLFTISLSAQMFIVESDSSGIQIPILPQSAIANPSEGLIIYNSVNQLVEWWDKEGFWVTLPSYKPFSSGISTLDQRFNNYGNLLFTHFGAQQLDTTGGSARRNTVIGVQAGNSMKQSSDNTVIGNEAGWHLTNAYGNTFLGNLSGNKLIDGSSNVAIGNYAMTSADSSSGNVAVGSDALRDGQGQTHNNVAIGNSSMKEFSRGSDNVVIGSFAAEMADTLHGAVLIGHRAGYILEVDAANTFIGNQSGNKTTTGAENTFLGSSAGFENVSGANNVFIGLNAGNKNVDGNFNVYLGDGAGFGNLGSSNVLLGQLTGVKDDFSSSNFTGNVFIGYEAGRNEESSNKLYIENSSSDEPLIYGEFDNDKIQINGSLNIRDFAKLVPQDIAPSSPAEGTVYYHGGIVKKLRIWTGVAWEDLN